MINMETSEERNFVLPESGEWKVLIDTQRYFDADVFDSDPGADKRVSRNASASGLYNTENSYGLKPRTIVVISK